MSNDTKAAPSAQQAVGSIAKDETFYAMMRDYRLLPCTGPERWNAICTYIDSRAAATPAQPIAPAHIERFSIYEDHGRANMMGDDDGEYVLYSHHIEALGKVAQPIAVSAPKLPDGWVALSITWDEGYPEEVAFGPQHLMDRLKKKLDKYYAGVIAARNSQAAAVSAPTDERANVDWHGLALDLEQQATRIESKTAYRAMTAASLGLRLMGAARAAAPVSTTNRPEFIKRVLLSVAEIPDRDSPEDQPEMMLVTSDELKGILLSAFEHEDEAAPVSGPTDA